MQRFWKNRPSQPSTDVLLAKDRDEQDAEEMGLYPGLREELGISADILIGPHRRAA